MLRLIFFAMLTIGTYATFGVAQQFEPRKPLRPLASPYVANLPTDRSLRVESGLPLPPTAPQVPVVVDPDPLILNEPEVGPGGSLPGGGPPMDLKSLLRPRFDLAAEWQPASGGVSIGSYDASAQMPLYPVFGPPPPFLTAGYSFTSIDVSRPLDLPQSLHEFSLGLALMRRINDRWMARLMVTGVFASDFENNSSDAWRIRGGGFALYRPNDCWSFALGALATGRDDVPVVPAIGAIWDPTPELRINLMLPTPKISRLVIDTPTRQHWLYAGAGISGGAWAYQRVDGVDDRLSYREWRLALGWESMPPRPPGSFIPTGTVWNAEIGYVLGREFEFDRRRADISLNDALLLRTRIKF